jgi:beta-xylosidase
VVKRNGYYYLFNARPNNASMYVSRSTNLFSGWTTQQLLSDGSGSGHQGGVVDLANGDWYGFAMRDSGPVGRMTNISPVTWVNDWPVFGNNNVIPSTSTKPILGQPIIVQPTSTGFDNSTLPPDWRWNHNPDNTRWSLTDRPGYLRLKPTVSPDLWNARDSLTYKGFGPTSQLVIEMDISNMQVGDNAGLGMIGKGLASLAVQRLAGGQAQLVLSTGTATATSGPTTQQAAAALGSANMVYLSLQMNFQSNLGQTAYSLDGLTWSTIGNSFALKWDWATGTFQGEQYAIFNYDAAQSSGYVDINRASFVQKGDYNRDGVVDDNDYSVWQNSFGQTGAGLAADGNLNGIVDAADYTIWRDRASFSGAGSLGAGNVPEPSTFGLMLFGIVALCPTLACVQTLRLFAIRRRCCEADSTLI